MSYKGSDIEDKAAVSTPPRAVVALREAIAELKGAIRSLDHGAIRAGLEYLERSRLRANAEMISLSATGGSGAHLQAFSDCLNDALELRGHATLLLTSASRGRSS
jgi:hypothetical protein